MINEERPIVFTITRRGERDCFISTKDSRGEDCEYISKALEGGFSFYTDLFEDMIAIAEELNDKGYAVLFEVD